MASTYTSNTGIELIATGEQSGTWGDTTNTNLQIIDRLTNGVGAVTLSGTTHTLTTTDGSLSEGQYKLLVLGGTPSGTCTITIDPNDQQKIFFVRNNSGQNAIFTQGSGSNVTVVDGYTAVIYADGAGAGANVVDLTPNLQVALTSLGVTATATELNILDGVTATTAELNYNDIAALGTSEASKVVTADANGNVKLQEELQVTAYIETVVALSGTSVTVDCDEANSFTLTTSGNTTFTFSYAGINLTTDDSYGFTLKVTAGGTHTLSWPASVDWPGGTAPDAPASGETDVFVFYTVDGGTNWYGFQAGDALA